MVHGLVGEAREELFQQLMMVRLSDEGVVDAKVPAIKWDTIVDQPSEARVGWSFLEDGWNQWEPCKEWWMFQRMYEEPGVRRTSPQTTYSGPPRAGPISSTSGLTALPRPRH
jgi:hypothetical protein